MAGAERRCRCCELQQKSDWFRDLSHFLSCLRGRSRSNSVSSYKSPKEVRTICKSDLRTSKWITRTMFQLCPTWWITRSLAVLSPHSVASLVLLVLVVVSYVLCGLFLQLEGLLVGIMLARHLALKLEKQWTANKLLFSQLTYLQAYTLCG